MKERLKLRIPYLHILIFTTLMMLPGCSREKEKETVVNISERIKQYFVPDSRTGIYRIDLNYEGGHWVINGETDHPEALNALLDSLERLEISYQQEVVTLPGEELVGKVYGLINVSVANLRADPRHPSELVTQALLGNPVKVLKKKGGWYLIQTPDKYLGWVDSGALVRFDEQEKQKYDQQEKLIFTSVKGFSWSMPDSRSHPVSDLVSGNILHLLDSTAGYYKIRYPDDRIGYVSKEDVEILSLWMGKVKPSPDSLVRQSFRLIGVPYLWGGTSVKGVDCSGFTKTVYLMNGLLLPRDASQQEQVGITVDNDKNFEELLSGDLLFFGRPATDSTSERIVHVGMWIGDMKFIHASGDVHISSMDRDDPLYDEYNYNRYIRSRRIIQTGDTNRLFVRKYF